MFGKALPCLSGRFKLIKIDEKYLELFWFIIAIGSALPPDYSYSINQQDSLNHERERVEMSRVYEPNPVDTSRLVYKESIVNVRKLMYRVSDIHQEKNIDLSNRREEVES